MQLLRTKKSVNYWEIFHSIARPFFWDNLKDYIGFIAAGFYNNPSDKLDVTAVTGTDGKTTVVNLAASIFANSFEDSAAIGTLGVVIYRKKSKKASVTGLWSGQLNNT